MRLFEDVDGPGVVLGVVGHDIHVVANRILEVGLAENGFRVYNIGISCHLTDFVDATLETGARAVVISSINGEGEEGCVGAGDRFAAAMLGDVLLYAGGNLVVGDHPTAVVDRLFLGYGFHRVFHRPATLTTFFETLRRDLSDDQLRT